VTRRHIPKGESSTVSALGRVGRSSLAILTVALVLLGIPSSPARAHSVSGGVWAVRRTMANGTPVASITYPNGNIRILCQFQGPSVTVAGFGTSTIYDFIESPRGWVSDLAIKETSYGQLTPCIARCQNGGSNPLGPSSTPPPPPAPGGVVYYSGLGDAGVTEAKPLADVTLKETEWSDGGNECSPNKAGSFADAVNGKAVTNLAGWSLGRLGPIYFIKAFPDRAKQISYIVLFDPGPYSVMRGSCDSQIGASSVIRAWPQSNPSAQLLIIAGEKTADPMNPSWAGGPIHRGIQDFYFPQIRGTAEAQRVTVCNFDSLNHYDAYNNYKSYMTGNFRGCPPGTNAIWHP
jgi:hypothetical protein